MDLRDDNYLLGIWEALMEESRSSSPNFNSCRETTTALSWTTPALLPWASTVNNTKTKNGNDRSIGEGRCAIDRERERGREMGKSGRDYLYILFWGKDLGVVGEILRRCRERKRREQKKEVLAIWRHLVREEWGIIEQLTGTSL